ncbi:MAG: nucleotidyltransferase domain-containing protein [Deltaproteobacteria bacterium]|nr:MAG: nucleotidyltransferase domain-containing protein [Deltaproteobacteria bacterium]
MIDLDEKHFEQIRSILEAIVPGARVLAFGSRVSGKAGKYSDLDLAVDAGRKLSLSELGRLKEAFSESDLPFLVDVIDWNDTEDYFRRIIAAKAVEIRSPTGLKHVSSSG